MRQDKLTTRFQEALADAQSIAVGNDQQYIEPVHLLAAMLRQDDGAARTLLQRAGVTVGPLGVAVEAALKRLPQVQGFDGQVQGQSRLARAAQSDRKGSTKARRYVHRQRAVCAGPGR